jgi:hypothetical protein
MHDNEEADIYIDDFAKRLESFGKNELLGEELQMGTRLSKTDKGARTNARIEASQKHEGFDETLTSEDELDEVSNDVTDELLKRALEKLFGE